MKHRFLLDENILYFAIFGIDESDHSDSTSTQLVRLIGQNCHRIVLNRFLLDRYWRHLAMIMAEHKRAVALEPVSFVVQLLKNSEKLSWEQNELPPLPDDARIPTEDVDIVRCALLARVRIITGDGGLRAAIKTSASLNLRAISPKEALDLAADS